MAQATVGQFQQPDLVVKIGARAVRVGDRQVDDLTNKEFAVLGLLCRNRHRMTTKGEIFDHLYADAIRELDFKIIDVFVCKLRKKLDPDDPYKYVITEWGRGYRIRGLLEFEGENPIETAELPSDAFR